MINNILKICSNGKSIKNKDNNNIKNKKIKCMKIFKSRKSNTLVKSNQWIINLINKLSKRRMRLIVLKNNFKKLKGNYNKKWLYHKTKQL